MKYCPHCNSTKTRSKGTRISASGIKKHRFECKECGRNFTIDGASKFDAHKELANEIVVITSAQNNCDVHREFLDSLIAYCDRRSASLHIIPVKYSFFDEDTIEWRYPQEYTLDETVNVCDKLRVLANINITPTIENPISGLDYLSKGDSLIIGHPQLQMKTLAVNSVESPAIITTTGSCTEPHYSQTKSGEKARFNHSYSAIIVECDDGCFHMRVLNADESGGFYDVDGYQYLDKFTEIDHIEAIVTGDEHAIFIDDGVLNATYRNNDSIVNMLKPKFIVRHDVLDCYSVSHHHRNNFFIRYGKFHSNQHMVEEELLATIEHILETTPEGSHNIIVSSNHADHLERWLNETDPKLEPWNAKIYHQLMYLVLARMHIKEGEFKYIQPFQAWVEQFDITNVSFTCRNESHKIFDIEISNHGDAGTNGSRGSLLQYSRLAFKNIIGHSHSPGILKGAYQVGTSSKLKMEYTKGPSSWMHTHCIIYPNGKRQLINIINGKWRKTT